MNVAVVAKPDDKWGETPCAFIELKEGNDQVTANDIITFCRDNLAHYTVSTIHRLRLFAENLNRKDSKIHSPR